MTTMKIRITSNKPNPLSLKNQDVYSREISLDQLWDAEIKNWEERKLKKPLDIKIYEDRETREYQKQFAKEVVFKLEETVSKREQQILELFKEGYTSNMDISSILKISQVEVRQLRYRIRKKTERIIRILSLT